LTQWYDRREFLRRVGTASLIAPTFSIVGCRIEENARGRESPLEEGLPIVRPILMPWSEEGVRIAAPAPELPIAYVSMGARRIFVEYGSRIQVSVMLAAHISVSSGHWRIPLPGDDLGVPIPAGDVLREFEEVAIGEWDPTADPTEGDFRIRRGRRVRVRVEFQCASMSARAGWFSAGPWDIIQCAGPGDGACREDFSTIGTGTRHSRRTLGTCTEPEATVRYLTWVCPEV
jgi:hypothetical protein